METCKDSKKTNKKPTYNYCMVPRCKNTTVQTPNKHFFTFPFKEELRNKWFEAMKRRELISPKSSIKCCEDHFDIEQDTLNFMRYQFMGGPLLLKRDVVPHKFDCQNKAETTDEPPVKRCQTKHDKDKPTPEVHGSRTKQPTEFIECINSKDNVKDGPEDPLSTPMDIDVEDSIEIKINNNTMNKKREESMKGTAKKVFQEDRISDDITDASDNVSLVSLSDSSSDELTDKHVNNTLYKIKLHTQLYLGLSHEVYFLIKTLVKNVQRPQIDILITLKKIRLDDQQSRLAIDFGLPKSSIEKIIKKTLSPLAHFLRELICFPEPLDVEEKLPMVFRSRFCKTQSIINCFEIKIQQPSNTIHQSLTWSSNMGCNTIKFLISVTPNGFINFVSDGYGGRVDDSILFGDCNIIDKIPAESTIMTDGVLKHIAPIIKGKRCKAVRQPYAKSGSASDKPDDVDTKMNAAVRSNVERTIQRLRSYKILAPQSCLSVKMLPFIDDIVSIACGLVNLKSV